MQKLKAVWRSLIEPSAFLTLTSERRQARVLSSLLLIILAIGVSIELITLPFVGPEALAPMIIGGGVTLLLIFSTYLLSRSRHFRLAAILTAVFFEFMVFLSTLSNLDSLRMLTLIYLIVPILLASMFLTIRLTLVVVFINLASVLLLPIVLQSSEAFGSIIRVPFTYLLVVSSLLLVAAHQRNMLEEERRAELAESEERYRTLLETAFEAVAILNDGKIIMANPGFSRWFGYDLAEVTGRPITEFVPEARPARLAILAAEENDQTYETHGRRHDGELIDVELVVRTQTYQGQPVKVIALRDITERKQAEAALRQAQRLDSIGVLAGGIAHDFNNMLTGIMAQSSLALAWLPEDSPARKHVQKSVRSAERAADLTRQLLAYAGKGQFEVQVFDINQLIRENVALLHATIPQGVLLEMALAEIPLPVEADRGQIQQVVLNLVINAAEAIQGGDGHVTISTEPRAIYSGDDLARFLGGDKLKSGRYVCLVVSDTGVGMSKETLSRIFDPFFTTKPTGHGLGLSALLGVVRTHRGAIHVDSEPGRSTTFTVLLPAADVTQLTAVADEERATEEWKPIPQVLVIDDEESVREAMVDILKLAGYPTLTAEDGREGIKTYAARQSEIGLIILDMKMPVMNGEETFRALQATDPNVKVILVSGYSESETTQQFAAYGFTDFLQKPFAVSNLVTKVQKALETPERVQ